MNGSQFSFSQCHSPGHTCSPTLKPTPCLPTRTFWLWVPPSCWPHNKLPPKPHSNPSNCQYLIFLNPCAPIILSHTCQEFTLDLSAWPFSFPTAFMVPLHSIISPPDALLHIPITCRDSFGIWHVNIVSIYINFSGWRKQRCWSIWAFSQTKIKKSSVLACLI